MAINSRIELFSQATPSTSRASSSKKSTKRLMKTEFSYNGAAVSRKHMKIKRSWDSGSPYLTPDAMHLSTTNEQTYKFVSSYPLAIDIYRANSDEFKAINKKNYRKVKKSVLTLPNTSVAALPQTCTVSDINDSTYFDRVENKVKKNTKKRLPVQNKKKSHRARKNFDYYDRDARYCSQMNLQFDCSSTHLMNHYNGDGVKINNPRNKKTKDESNPSDVWAVLKNINKFQFEPSPTMSFNSFKPKKKQTVNKKKKVNNRDQRFYYETETEEIAYVCVSQSISQCSSADRVTIIDKCEQSSTNETEFDKPLLLTSNASIQNSTHEIQPKEYLDNLAKNIKSIKPKYKKNSGHTTQNIQSDECCKDTIPNNALLEKSQLIKYRNVDKITQNRVFKESSLNKEKNKVFSTSRLDKDICNSNILSCKTVIPKTTGIEIRRRLANLKYPIVILEKDQVTSFAQNVTSNFLQFNGLENQIWPFMLEWTGQTVKKLQTSSPQYADSNILAIEQNKKCVEKLSRDMNIYKQPKKDDKKIIHHSFTSNRDNKPCKLRSIFVEKNRQSDNKETKKPTTKQFKDEKLHLLYQMSPENAVTNAMIHKDSKKADADCKNKDVNTETYIQLDSFCDDGYIRNAPQNMKSPWARAKRANSFIDGIIRNIESGVYYNQECKDVIHRFVHTKEVSIQASLILYEDHKSEDSKHSFLQNNSVQVLPGFKDAMAAVEIKALDTSKLTIKHCVANIIVQFDVMPFTTDRMFLDRDSSLSLIPLASLESESEMFKCKTTIINSQLPADICSILPIMMRNIKNMQAVNLEPSYQYDKKASLLSTIPETASVECNTFESPLILQSISELSMQGNFSRRVNITKFIIPNIIYNYASANKNSDLGSIHLPQMVKKEFENIIKPKLLLPIKLIHRHENIDQNLCVPTNKLDISTRNTMTLQPYYNHKQMNMFQDYNAMYIINKMFNYHRFNLNFTTMSHLFNFIGDVKTITLMTEKANNVKVSISVTIDKPKTTSLFISGLPDVIINNDKNIMKSIDYNCHSNATKTRKEGSNNFMPSKTRKRMFVKLNKKCKSTSSISSEVSTSLSKITNVDDFFQALGSGKILSCVCEGQLGKRIMSCINEMKIWTTVISSRQALLVLLLNNKKETQNLIRYKPILLQGIAVNRITRAAELDMEIEVIERERLNTLEHEGITYIPLSPENQDSLFEELYWIAKTTASDYQKPFDESSERLLKSLLHKRKKLNPSYLRVMARYVGLGLLKSQKNNN